ncbi:MAG: IMP cyclohydrolase [Dehalococcoidia bacterium]
MYVGRIVAVARNKAGANAILYRVSSRSFPNRMAVDNSGTLAVVPRPGAEGDIKKNPYIAYNALRLAGDYAIATNGSHTDPIAEKIGAGVPVRDALASCLLAMDYEKDDLMTPRIAAVVDQHGGMGWLAIVRHDALVVKEVALEAGRATYLATYVADDVRETQSSSFDAHSAAEAAAFAVSGGAFADLDKPVTSVAALANDAGFALGTHLVE